MQSALVEEIRRFNRFYTGKLGLLAEHLPESEFTLAEARVMYELAQSREQTAADIIRSLGMDKAHVSRIVARFMKAGLVKNRVSPRHGKHKLLSLSSAGTKAFARLNAGTESQITSILASLSPANRECVAQCTRKIQRLLEAKAALPEHVRLRSLKVGDLGWVAHRQAVLYEQEYGWDWTYEALVSQILGDFALHFDPEREDAWVAELDGEIVGSVFLMKSKEVRVAKLRLLYVEPSTRGLGVGSNLVRQCTQRARELGYHRLTLWTVDILASARKIYQSAGFTLTEENPLRSFGKDLVGQSWTLELRAK